jgi:DNA-binding response OmpR family regulator
MLVPREMTNSEKKMKALLVEKQSHDTHRAMLQEGFVVETANNTKEADSKVRLADYKVIILEMDNPGADGLSVLKEWRRGGIDSYVVVTTPNNNVTNRVNALDAGADDCVAKPYHMDELMARLRTFIRRGQQNRNTSQRIFDLEIDAANRVVKRAGKLIPLTPREFDLLSFLAKHRGKAVTRPMIREHLYDGNDEQTSNVVDVYIRYLRKKIDQGSNWPLILTSWGEGYMLRGDS